MAAERSPKARAHLDASLDADVELMAVMSAPRTPDDAGQDAASPSPSRRTDADAATKSPPAIDASVAISKKGAGGATSPQPMDAGNQTKTPARDAAMPMPVDASSPRDAGSTHTADAASSAPRCKPGVYAGTFSGSVQASAVTVSMITGAINANLTTDETGQYLLLNDLRVVGADDMGNTMTVTVSGKVNCMTYQLEDGLLDNGTYYLVSSRAELPFVGVASGMYSMSPYALHGSYTTTVQSQAATLVRGDGEFSLTLSR